MPEKQLTYNQEFADKTNEPFVLITKPTAILYINPSEKHKSLEVSYNTRLPLLSEDTISYHVLLPNGQKAWLRKMMEQFTDLKLIFQLRRPMI